MEVNGDNQIVIEIVADTEKAKKDIRSLKNELKGIGSSFNASELTNAFKQMQNTIKGAKLKNVVDPKATNEAKAIAKELERVKKEAERLETIKAQNIFPSDFVDGLKQAGVEIKDFEEDVNNTITKMELVGKGIAPNTEQFATISQYLKNIGLEVDGIKTNADGISTITAKQTKELQKQEKSVKKQRSGWDKIATAVKRIMFYRLVRGIYQQLETLVKNSMNALYTISEQMGSSFAPAIDSIKSSFVYLANSVMAIIAPIIEQLAPVIEIIVDSVAQLANAVAKLMASFMGSKYITQAKKSLEKFNAEAKKTTQLDIDELNVVNQDTDASDWFDITEIEEGQSAFTDLLKIIADFTQQINESGIDKILGAVFNLINEIIKALEEAGIKDFLNAIVGFTTRINDIIVRIITAITPILSAIVKLLEPIFIIVETILDAVLDLIDPLVEILTVIIQPIANIIEAIQPILTIIAQLVSMIIKVALEPLKVMFNYLAFIFDLLSPIFDVLNIIFELVKPLFELIQKGLDGIKTGLKSVGNFFVKIINGVITGFEGFINIFIKAINFITEKISGLWTWMGIPAIPKIPEVQLRRIPELATGGIVEDGLFMANHNELIGSFAGGKTAVANNEQITDGIYQAVRDALQDAGFGGNSSDNNGKTTEVNVYLDSKKIARQVKTVEKEQGVKIFSGATNYGR